MDGKLYRAWNYLEGIGGTKGEGERFFNRSENRTTENMK